MKQRYIDITSLAKDDKDFKRRRIEHGALVTIAWLVFAFFILVMAALQVDIIGITMLMVIFACIFLAIIALIIILINRINQRIFSNDFENTLFAGAAGAGVAFFFIMNKNGNIVYYNPSCRNYFPNLPYTQGPAYMALMKNIGLADKEINAPLFSIASDSEKNIPRPFVLHDLSGKKHRLVLSIEVIARPDGYFVIKALQDSSGKLPETCHGVQSIVTQIFDEMPWGVYVTFPNGIFAYVNHPFSSMIGYYNEELTNGEITFNDILYNEEERKKKFNLSFEEKIVLKDKANKPLQVFLKQILVPGRDEDEYLRYGFLIPSGAMSMEGTVFEQALQGIDKTGKNKSLGCCNEGIWENFIKNSPIATALLNTTGCILQSNTTFRKLMRQDLDKKSNFLTFLDEDSSKEVLAALKNRTGNDSPIEIRLSSETDITASLYINLVKDSSLIAENANSGYIIVYLVDSTEQKNLERRFIHSQKMQAVGQLAGGIAHDFNNLLTAMIGFCDLLLTRHPPGEQSFADIMQIKQNANRAANLVRQLLAFSRKQTLQPEVVDVTDSLAELSNLIRRLIGENIKLDILYGRNIWPVKVDQGQFEQVIINLAVNARDAMKDGGTLTIRTRNIILSKENPIDSSLVSSPQDDEIEDGEYTVIDVIDTGHGIPDNLVSQIFDPFFTTKQVGEGTGLGLSTVYGIIQQTGGHVYVSSKNGKGTCFSIFLKRHFEENKKISSKASDIYKENIQDLTGTGTILLVEDEAPVRIFSSRALRNKGYSVLEADCGEVALKIIDENKADIDIIITDVVMPGISGPDMIKQIKERFPDICVIFISGYGEDAFVNTYGTDRAFNFLPKPFTLKELAAKVKIVLEQRDS